MKQRSSLGTSDFKSIREENQYFIDKSMLVKELAEGSKVTLITRPRRFGKTLGMSMLNYFYSLEEDNEHLFEGLEIMNETAFCEEKMGRHPVIFLSFKDIKEDTWSDTMYALKKLIDKQIDKFRYLMSSPNLSEKGLNDLKLLYSGNVRERDYAESLKLLTEMLYLYHGAKTVVLIDEYDTPIISGWQHNYFNEVVKFMRALFGSTFKDNNYLEKGVMTGILRIAKESLFSGLNNFGVCSMLENRLNDKFGFTEEEVRKMLKDYNLNGKELAEIQQWYNGYDFRGVTIYNPWSVLSYIDNNPSPLRPYWVNTGDDVLLKKLMLSGSQSIKDYMQRLIEGEKITLKLNEHLIFSELETNIDAVWNLLLFAGYLKVENVRTENRATVGEVSIPNIEVYTVYRDKIQSWFAESISNSDQEELLRAVLSGNELAFKFLFTGFVTRIASVHDTAENHTENFYHAFMLGLFALLERTYIVKSNKESGMGRYDIALIPRVAGKSGVLFEIKTPSSIRKETMESAIIEAENQKKSKKYDTELIQHGANPIHRFAIAVKGKSVEVKLVTED